MIGLLRILARRRLTKLESAEALRAIMRGEATTATARITGFALSIAVHGESADEPTGMVHAACEFATPVKSEGNVPDTCGTGGDAPGTFSISTASTLVAAACGVRVADRGDRSASSACGRADVPEELGVRIDLDAPRSTSGSRQVIVGESGTRHAEDARRLVGPGVDAVLAGELLVRAKDPATVIKELAP